MAGSELVVQTIEDATVVNFRQRAIIESAKIEAIAQDLYAIVDEKASRKLVLDFTGVQYLSSQALGIFITLKKKADEIKGQVAICGLKNELRQLFKIMKLEKIFPFFADEQEALAHFNVFRAT